MTSYDAETQAWFDEVIDLMEYIDGGTNYTVLCAGEGEEEGEVTLTLMRTDVFERETTLDELLAKVTPDNRHDAVSW